MPNLVPKKATLGHSWASWILYFVLHQSDKASSLRSKRFRKMTRLETLATQAMKPDVCNTICYTLYLEHSKRQQTGYHSIFDLQSSLRTSKLCYKIDNKIIFKCLSQDIVYYLLDNVYTLRKNSHKSSFRFFNCIFWSFDYLTVYQPCRSMHSLV